MRITGKPSMLPNCVEAQLKSGDAGDIYGFKGFKVEGDKTRWFNLPKVAGGLMGLKKIEGNEKEPGQWNKYEITVDGDKITAIVNGKKVNDATGCDVRAGKIGLQSEGGEIHFKTVTLTPPKPEAVDEVSPEAIPEGVIAWVEESGGQVIGANVFLRGTPVNDLTPLANLTNLELMDLGDTHISDLAPLANLTNLKVLYLIDTQVSDEDIAKLKEALPECSIMTGKKP
jgi:hypothetical protein